MRVKREAGECNTPTRTHTHIYRDGSMNKTVVTVDLILGAMRIQVCDEIDIGNIILEGWWY